MCPLNNQVARINAVSAIDANQVFSSLRTHEFRGVTLPASLLLNLPNHRAVADRKCFMLSETLARGWENLVARFGGPMSFRLLVQPAVAIFFAVRAGIRDAREGNPTFLGCALSNLRSWSPRMRQSWRDVGTIFIIALILDAIYQLVVQSGIFALELLIMATLLALVPYMIVRDLASRVARWIGVGKQAAPSIPTDSESQP
jgi:hypothetical protein